MAKRVGKLEENRSGSRLFFGAFILILAILAAYHNSFSGPFIFDDQPAIPENPTIRHLWPLSRVLSPPASVAITGRPLVNLSLAINYAMGGTAVLGYHIFNLVIHILSGLTLFGIVRRTLLRSRLRQRFSDPWLPLAVAILWSVHPLQTESVTYIVQRAESLMGLFYLLTIYCFVRGVESRPEIWHTLAVAACLCGMAVKEVMISAPVMVLLYDRTFVSGTFKEALRQRWRMYLGLAATWLMLAWLVFTGGALQSQNAGAHSALGPAGYALSECWAIARYLRLSIWPYPLILDYGGAISIKPASLMLPYALFVMALLAGTLVSLWRWPVVGFAGCWFFGILALTSTIFPLGDSVFEHRMYLPLAAVVALVVLGIYNWLGRRSWGLFLAMALGCIILTSRRNEDYKSELAIWSDTVAKRPANARAQYNLGHVYFLEGRVDEAMARYRMALDINPDYQDAKYNLGVAFLQIGQVDEAERWFQATSNYFDAQNNLGAIAERRGNLDEAITHYREALRLAPDNTDVINNLGVALAKGGNLDEAIQHFRTATSAAPEEAKSFSNLGNALGAQGKTEEAISNYQRAIELNPNYAEAHNNLGNALAKSGNLDAAIAHYQKAVEINPEYVKAWFNLGMAQARAGKLEDTVQSFNSVLRLQPNNVEAHCNLGVALAKLGSREEAAAHFTEALRLEPDLTAAKEQLRALQSGP